MSRTDKNSTGRPGAADEKEARLAAALRANLKRRKAPATKATKPEEPRE